MRPAFAFLFNLVTTAGFFYLVYYLYQVITRRFSFENRSFQQAGVRVDYANQTISIGNSTYAVSEVVSVRSVVRPTPVGEQVAVNIEVANLAKPVHVIVIIGKPNADSFTRKLTTALRKAGGPRFNQMGVV